MDAHVNKPAGSTEREAHGVHAGSSERATQGESAGGVLPLASSLGLNADPRLTAVAADLQRISLMGVLQRSVGNQSAMRYLERTSTRPSGPATRVQRIPNDEPKSKIAYPPGLLAACPSLANSSRVEAYAGDALRALVGAYSDSEKMKASLATAKNAFQTSMSSHGQSLAAPPSQDDLDKIKSATRVADPTQDPAGASTRDVTIHVSELLSTYRGHLNDLKTLFDQISDVDKGAVANAALKLDTEKKKLEQSAKQSDVKNMQDQSTLPNILGPVLNQIGQGFVGEAMKLATASLVEKMTVAKNAENPQKPMEGTLLAMGLEDLLGGTGGVGVLVLNAATDLVNRITGVRQKQDVLQEQISKLQVTIEVQSILAALDELTRARTQLEIHQKAVLDKRQALDDDATHLRQLMASLNVAVDKRAGVSTFEDAAAAISAADAELGAADAYEQSCKDLKSKTSEANGAMSLLPASMVADSGADPRTVMAELDKLGKAEDKEIADTETEKTSVNASRALVQQRVGTAFDAAMAGVAGAQRTWGAPG